MLNLDLLISQYLFQSGRELPGFIAPFLAVILIWILFAFVLYRALFLKNRREQILFLLRAGAAAALGLGLNALIAYFYFRTRPFAAWHFDALIAKSALEKSFPSDHAAVSWALAAVVYLYNKNSGYWAGAAAGLICLGRVLAGVHYVSDVLAGAAIGMAAACLVLKFLPAPAGRLMMGDKEQ